MFFDAKYRGRYLKNTHPCRAVCGSVYQTLVTGAVEREKREKLKRNRGQFLQGQKRKKEKPVAQRQEIVIGTFALV